MAEVYIVQNEVMGTFQTRNEDRAFREFTLYMELETKKPTRVWQWKKGLKRDVSRSFLHRLNRETED